MSSTGKTNSIVLTEGPSRAAARAMLRAVGFSREDLAKPIIGVANTWTEVGPCNYHLRDVAAAVKEGIRAAGGTPMEFNTITVNDGITMGTQGMKASLISREVIADSIELITRANAFDGLVCIAGCDKNMPGSIMALARLDIPGLMLYGGSIAPGHMHVGADGKTPEPGSSKEIDVTIQQVFEAIGAHSAGKITDAQLDEAEATACPGPGACGGQFTANTMAMAGEFLGISPIQLTGVPAMSKEKHHASFEAGKLVMDLARAGLKPSQIITRESLDDAISAVCASGGSHQCGAAPHRHREGAQHSAQRGRLRRHQREDAVHLRPAARRQVRRQGLPGRRRLARAGGAARREGPAARQRAHRHRQDAARRGEGRERG
jgi:dihydroxy-acid dehydratase